MFILAEVPEGDTVYVKGSGFCCHECLTYLECLPGGDYLPNNNNQYHQQDQSEQAADYFKDDIEDLFS